MNWEDLQDAIKAWLQGITGLVVVWENEPRPAILRHSGFCILGTPTDITPMGQDFVQEVVSGNEVEPVVVGQRIFTVPVRCISRSQSPNSTGRYHLERARLSLKFPSVLETFRQAGLGIVRAEPTVQFDAKFDDRFESIAAFELTFSAAALLQDPENQGTIGTIQVSSAIEDAPTPPNLDDEVFAIDP